MSSLRIRRWTPQRTPERYWGITGASPHRLHPNGNPACSSNGPACLRAAAAIWRRRHYSSMNAGICRRDACTIRLRPLGYAVTGDDHLLKSTGLGDGAEENSEDLSAGVILFTCPLQIETWLRGHEDRQGVCRHRDRRTEGAPRGGARRGGRGPQHCGAPIRRPMAGRPHRIPSSCRHQRLSGHSRNLVLPHSLEASP